MVSSLASAAVGTADVVSSDGSSGMASPLAWRQAERGTRRYECIPIAGRYPIQPEQLARDMMRELAEQKQEQDAEKSCTEVDG